MGKYLGAMAVGVVVIAVAIWSIRNTRRLSAVGYRAFARVVDRERSERETRQSDGSMVSETFFYPIVEFDTPDGGHYRIPVYQGATHANSETGITVPIIYDPDNPKNIRIDNPQGRNTGLMYLGVAVGIGVIAYGFAGLF